MALGPIHGLAALLVAGALAVAGLLSTIVVAIAGAAGVWMLRPARWAAVVAAPFVALLPPWLAAVVFAAISFLSRDPHARELLDNVAGYSSVPIVLVSFATACGVLVLGWWAPSGARPPRGPDVKSSHGEP